MKKYVLLVLLFPALQLSAQTLDSAAIHRIGDYGKLWYIISLFHPEMAYGRINGDSLFLHHANNLIANPTAANFKEAVRGMLSELRDASTRVSDDEQLSTDTIALGNRPLLTWLPDSVALLYFDPKLTEDDYSNENTKLLDTLRKARRLIFDLRGSAAVTDVSRKYYDEQFIKNLITDFSDRELSYPAGRTRIHYGHEDDYGNVPFYFQGWLLKNGQGISKSPHPIRKPLCLLVNRFDDYLAREIISFQKTGLARVVADDSLPGFETASDYSLTLADSLTVNIRLSETIYQDGSNTFQPDTLLRHSSSNSEALVKAALQQLQSSSQNTSAANAVQNLFVSSRSSAYDSLPYPSASLRLMGLARYWGIINYFCPNKDRFQKKWADVLYEYVPLVIGAKDSTAYHLAVAKLITEIHDGHGFFGSTVINRFHNGSLDMEVKFVEGKTIVYKMYSDTLRGAISVGDEIISINGTPINKVRDSIAQYIGASNNPALQRDVNDLLLTGKMGSGITLSYKHNGKPASLTMNRTPRVWQHPDTSVIFKKLSDKLGYADFGRLEALQLDSMFNLFRNTDAFILDDRSYPRGTVWSMVNYLTNKTVTGAVGTTMIADSPDTSTLTKQEELWTIPVHPKPQLYKGKIIILVNEITQSQAEYSCMVLQAAIGKRVVIIGSQTAGADGDVTGIRIPGGIYTSFSGHGVHYPDGRATQGIGIIPDVVVKPTIAGIKANRDEVLERAVLFAKTGK